MSEQTPKDVIEFIREQEIRMVDLRFMDMLGSWQHFTVPAHELHEDAFEEGFGFDGSSVRGWKTINASDMLVLPDARTAKVDPFMEIPTLVLLGNAADTITRADYERCPRSLAARAEEYLRSTGIADTCYVGPEAEFFIFDDVRYESEKHRASFAIDSDLGHWNTAREEFPNLGYKIRHKGGYVPVPPSDAHHDLRTEMVMVLEDLGIVVERQHMEVATGGQAEIDIRYDSLLSQADKLTWFKYVIKNVARRAGKTATFMPKPLFGDNGNGMHTPPVAVEGRAAAVRWRAVRRSVGARAALRGRDPQARASALRLHQPEHQQLQAAGPGLRGAGQPRLQLPQPLGVDPHPHVQQLAQGDPHRVPDAGSLVQPLPRVLRSHDGRTRRHPKANGCG